MESLRLTPDSSEFNLGQLLIFCRRWLLKIILFTVLFTALAAAFIFTRPRQFQSHLSVFVTGTNSIAASAQVQAQLATLFGLSSGGTEYVVAILDSDQVHLAVLEALNLITNEDFWYGNYKDRNQDEALRQLRSLTELDAPQPPLMGPVRLDVETISPELSQRIANQYLYLLNQKTAKETKNRSVFLEEQLKESQVELEKAELALQSFAESEKIAVPLDDLGKEEFLARVELDSQRILGEVELKALKARLDAPGDMTVQMTIQSEIAGLEAKLGQIDRALSVKEVALDALPKQAKQYGDLLRKFKSREKIFEIYLEHYELARLYEVGKSETRPYRLIDKPYLPTAPVKRHGLLKLIASMLVGGSLVVGWALMIEALELAKKEEKLLKKNAQMETTEEAE